jgi:L-lactate utilization protein LutB
MTDKEVFISRLRCAAAVRVVSPRRAIVAVEATPPRVVFAIDTDGVDAFDAALTAVGGTVHRAADLIAARALVVEVIGTRSPVVLGCEPDVAALELKGERWPECGLHAAAEAAVTVVGCVAMVAATGSVVVDARSARGRSVSLLPPVCIVVARSSRLVATPADVLRNRDDFWPGSVPSQVVFITGPSRSADIEMTLTRGVHGPGELHVVVVDGEGE